jgi:hypothetical protein
MRAEPIFAKLGRKVRLNDNGKTESCKALIQPLRYKNKMYLDGVYSEIGFNSQGHYLYIGPPTSDLTLAGESARIESDSVSYRIDRAERVYNGSEIFYIWAIIRTIVEVD